MAQTKNTAGLKKIWLIIVGLVIVLAALLIIAGSGGKQSNNGQNQDTEKKTGPGATDVSTAPPSEIPAAPQAKEEARVFEAVAPAEGGYMVKDTNTQSEVVLFIASDTNVLYQDDLTAIRPGNFLLVTRYREGGNGILVLDMVVSKKLVSPAGGGEPPASPASPSN